MGSGWSKGAAEDDTGLGPRDIAMHDEDNDTTPLRPGADSANSWQPEWRHLFPIAPFRETMRREYNGTMGDDHTIDDKVESGRKQWQMVLWVFIKWAFPMFVTGCCTFACMVLLHVGTYYYVHEMHMETHLFTRTKHMQSDDFNVSLSIGWREDGNLTDAHGRAQSLSFGSLNDPIHLAMGFSQVDISMLDKIAACFPVIFVLMAVLMDELGVWTKVMFCNALLAIWKGLFAAMTTVPDSKGWHECTVRLGDTGLRWMMEAKMDPMAFIKMELFGVNGVHIRWCADMMFSGHTYFTTLYALGLYELAYLFTREWDKKYRVLCLGLVALIAIGEQVVEVYFVLLNRFHYTMDVVMAILLTFLFFTNSAIAEVCKRWVYFGLGGKKRKRWGKEMARWVARKREELVGELKKKGPPYDTGMAMIPFKELGADADVFVPPCCNPCCCLHIKDGTFAGTRHHVYDDEDLGDMLFACTRVEQQQMCDHMRLSMSYDIKQNKNFKLLHQDPEP
mmetsp:Transcript_9097/g.32227  ORF Transcript_9097/g.32227 Transcript_9097/m.32227 type:complete len:506 (+) Transcript_9097:158-1675(+)